MLICHCDKCDRNCVSRKEPAESWKRYSAFTIPHCFELPANRGFKTTDKYCFPSSKKHYENDLGEFLWCLVLNDNRGRRPRAGNSLDQTAAGWGCASVPDTERAKKHKGQINTYWRVLSYWQFALFRGEQKTHHILKALSTSVPEPSN